MAIIDEHLGFFASDRRPIHGPDFLGVAIQYNNLGPHSSLEVSRIADFGVSRDQKSFIVITREGSENF